MSEMIERVGRALYEAHWSALPPGSRPAWPGDTGPDYWLWQAEYAIRAMRGPLTISMLAAASEILPHIYPDDPASDADIITEAWQAMIDAALAEKP